MSGRAKVNVHRTGECFSIDIMEPTRGSTENSSVYNDYKALTQLVDTLTTTKAKEIIDDAAGWAKVSASVVALLRIKPSKNVDSSTVRAPTTVAEFLEAEWVKTGRLELLFMKRAFNPRDRWGGHVAFPGGKKDGPHETPQQVAERETLEEVGLNLADKSKFALLGRLDDRYTSAFRGKVWLICPFVYLQLTPESPEFKLQHREVFGVRWVPVQYFSAPKFKSVDFPLFRSQVMYFPGWLLPIGSDIDNYISTPKNIAMPSSVEAAVDYHLWGLTLMVVDDLLFYCGVIKRGQLEGYTSDFNSPIVKAAWYLLTLTPWTLRAIKWTVLGVGIAAVSVYISRRKANL